MAQVVVRKTWGRVGGGLVCVVMVGGVEGGSQVPRGMGLCGLLRWSSIKKAPPALDWYGLFAIYLFL
jgi:hypothetical protein